MDARRALAVWLCALCVLGVLFPRSGAAACFYYAPGNLKAGSGIGVRDARNWAQGIINPVKLAIAVAKSQVYSPGGGRGARGGQCHPSNFEPHRHRDTFCETRGRLRESLNCPRKRIHQGIDINGGTRQDCLAMTAAEKKIRRGAASVLANIVPVVAVADGTISYIGSYTVDLRPDNNTALKFRYLHMKMDTLQVRRGQKVKQGQTIGYVWNDFAGNTTTFHLHFEIVAVVNRRWRHVSPYMAFVRSYEKTARKPCRSILR